MTMVKEPLRPQSGDLERAISAKRLLEASGLGPMEWIGPVWIGVLSEVDGRCLEFLASRIRQDTRLRRNLKRSRKQKETQRLQIHAIRAGLDEFASATGRSTGVNRRFIATCDA